MTIRFAIAATAALFMVQFSAAEASLAPMPQTSSAAAVSSADSAASAGLGLLSSPEVGPASTIAHQAGSAGSSGERLAFGVRVPGLKTVGRVMGALTPGGNSGNAQVEERRSSPQVRDHRSQSGSAAPRVRDHRVAPRVRDHRAAPNVRERTRVEARRGQQAQRPQLREELGQ